MVIYNLEAVAALLKIFIWLALVYFQKYWLLNEKKLDYCKLKYFYLFTAFVEDLA